MLFIRKGKKSKWFWGKAVVLMLLIGMYVYEFSRYW